MSAPPLVEAVGLVRRFASAAGEVRAVDGVSLAVARGSFTAITGPSGGGKSTLLALLGALDRPTDGHVRFDGQDLADASAAALTRVRRRIGFVFQHSPMLRRLPAWQNVAYPLIPRGVTSAERERRARELLGRVGLADRAAGLPEHLSAGERQRVGIARALVADPDLVLADEPTSNLDPRSAEAVLDLLFAAHASGRTVVVATHDPAVLARAAVHHELDAGRLVPPRSISS
jgi:ABC-type lipoprotein export system ATPase subunit